MVNINNLHTHTVAGVEYTHQHNYSPGHKHMGFDSVGFWVLILAGVCALTILRAFRQGTRCLVNFK